MYKPILGKVTQMLKLSIEDVVNLVGRQIDSDKRLQRWLGAPLQSRPIWLVYDFPKKAPSEYERPG